ncbi:MAG TPA: hypothetical protein VG168_03760 [Bryobacteraceae bacterium]|nr:hypothetical protein [Bryobacteraceae bacterium]
MVRWEFWPRWALNPPVVVWVLLLGLRHRCLSLFSAVNPSIPSGGFLGESKMDILRGLAPAGERIARTGFVAFHESPDERLKSLRASMNELNLRLPVVLKPDAGHRGSAVKVIRTEKQLRSYIQHARFPFLVQEYVSGLEFGVFYYRFPHQKTGRIFSITEKRFPSVVGDGISTVEELILQDERAVCLAQAYIDQNRQHARRILDPGESLQLVELGTHWRGSIFLDGGWLLTPALEEAIDAVAQTFEGFYFGRFDIRTRSAEDFQRGQHFKVLELNGVTSESTNIYDPNNSLFDAYRVLFKQWSIAFEIARQNRSRGAAVVPASALFRQALNYRHISRLFRNGSEL